MSFLYWWMARSTVRYFTISIAAYYHWYMTWVQINPASHRTSVLMAKYYELFLLDPAAARRPVTAFQCLISKYPAWNLHPALLCITAGSAMAGMLCSQFSDSLSEIHYRCPTISPTAFQQGSVLSTMVFSRATRDSCLTHPFESQCILPVNFLVFKSFP